MLGFKYKERLVKTVRTMFHQNFLVMGITPRECIEDQLAGGTREQYRYFIKHVGDICKNYTDSELEDWFFEKAGWWSLTENLRTELLHGVEIAKINLKARNHKDRLVNDIRRYFGAMNRHLKMAPSKRFEQLFSDATKEQLRVFIKQIGHISQTYTDSDLEKWFFEEAEYWNPEYDLRAEFLQGVELAKKRLKEL